MDGEASAGRNSTRRGAHAVEDGAGGGLEVQVVPLGLYDSARAKIDANLRWLFAKAYGVDHIPVDLLDPFYTDQYEQEHIKPPIIHLLLSGELYCRVCELILHAKQSASLQSHQSIIQTLSRKGIYVLETDNTPVSDLDLQSNPIKMNSHIHLIDALMMAYTAEMISIENVVSSVKRFSNFSASKELPFDLEDAMIMWINKVNMKLREITDKQLKMKQHFLDSPSHQKVRYRRDHLSGCKLQCFPLLEDLLKDVSDGMALLAVIHFYCPELIRLEDIYLKEVPSIADSLYNIRLLREFSNDYLNKCFYLKPEDMLYSPPVLKINVMLFIAELFWWFEVVKPDFVQPRHLQEVRDVRLLLQAKSTQPHVPISSNTKRFQVSSNSPDVLATPTIPDLSNKSNSSSPGHAFQRRRQQKVPENDGTAEQRKRADCLTHADGQPKGSLLPWPERRLRPLPQPVPFALQFPVEGGGDSTGLACFVNKDSLASNVMSITPKHMLRSGPQIPPYSLSGQSLLGHIRIEDEEEIVEEEELVAVIHPYEFSQHQVESNMEQDELEIQNVSTANVSKTRYSPCLRTSLFISDQQGESYYLEPLMPAVVKSAKEKSINLSKEAESGESAARATKTARKTSTLPSTSHWKIPVTESNNLKSTFIHGESVSGPLQLPREGSVDSSQQSHGFFLHLSGDPETPNQVVLPEEDRDSPFSTGLEVGYESDSDIADLVEDEEEDQMQLAKELVVRQKLKCFEDGDASVFGEGESAKLREDMKVSERGDKENFSGCSSPCLSTASWVSTCSTSGSTSMRMTSFAERKLHKIYLRDGFSSTSSSQKTTPDGSDNTPCPPWQLKSDASSSGLGKEPGSELGRSATSCSPVVPSELLQLHMQLEEQRRAIEYQKKKMEALSARQRLKLGKAAFFNIVKKGGGKSDTLPQPLKHPQEISELTDTDRGKVKFLPCKDDSCLEALKGQAKSVKTRGGPLHRDNAINASPLVKDSGTEPDLNECSRSIELLNDALSCIQQQMMQLSFQQKLLMNQSAVSSPGSQELDSSPTANTAQTKVSTSDSKSFSVVQFVDIGRSHSGPARCPPRLSSSQRKSGSKTSELKQIKEKASIKSNSQPQKCAPSFNESSCGDQVSGGVVESSKLERSIVRKTTFRVHDNHNQLSNREGNISEELQSQDPPVIFSTVVSSSESVEEDEPVESGKEAVCGIESTTAKSQLIEVDISELKEPLEDGSAHVPDCSEDREQKNALGFFFKDDEKAEDEMAKRRTAFLRKQQRKAEEARLRKQQQEAESELKRDEARRKAEEERVRKEEEKARRELIKQEYLRRKQQALIEEQGLVNPRPRTKSRRGRPKSLHREGFNSLSKGTTTPEPSDSHRGSTLSLATEADSVMSAGAETQRAGSLCSVELLPILSRGSCRNMEKDCENGSIASSIMSAEYTGPKLFKEPSSKSNKPIIINAIAHCCLAGKVNEPQKNVILEEVEKCESNHLIILFRDGGCQFRAIYLFSPETEEIIKFTGTGPRTVSGKMIDKLYKYNSDRKQFTIIPAKTVSVSVDALTIHNHLWQVKRLGSSRRK
ncbi:calmodulin-regulated spectrin-associated protein 1a isoform X2 [Thalassophryne amazonica]|uniref:calmodulin-regulated spectrin-associated protein 1a isoform X2 n=1 Tax=Thalassophryne amazonica TaxID=390379 RepID=UPI0014713692|nr:calmodulin-regulated spectrin-associated protein 1a isoform X2 [Thalassophryne amazonica]